jgi:hypothetical protein
MDDHDDDHDDDLHVAPDIVVVDERLGLSCLKHNTLQAQAQVDQESHEQRPFPRRVACCLGFVMAERMSTSCFCSSSLLQIQSISTNITSRVSLLRARLDADGYLYIRSFFSRDRVAQCNRELLSVMHSAGCCVSSVDPTISPSMSMSISGTSPSWSLLDRHASVLKLCPSLTALLEDPALYALISCLLNVQHIRTIPYKWLRAVPSGLNTGPHYDRVYLGAGSQRLLTIWMPLMDISTDVGSLCLVPASNSSKDPVLATLREKHAWGRRVGSDGTRSGWISEYPESIGMLDGGGKTSALTWATDDFKMGDIVVSS